MTPQIFLILSLLIFSGVLGALIHDYLNTPPIDPRINLIIARINSVEKFFLDLGMSTQDQINELSRNIKKAEKKPLLPTEDIPTYSPTLKAEKDK